MEERAKKKVKKFIADNFLFGKEKLEDNQPLFKEGIIDSFGFVTLLSFIEKEFNIFFNRADISMDNFDNINKITAKIKERVESKEKRKQ